MKSKPLILFTALALLAPLSQAGESSDSLFGTWSGKQHRRSQVTGGQLTLFTEDVKPTVLASATANTALSGSISVPNLSNGTFRVEQITGTLTRRGRIVAHFPSGHLRGHVDQGLHDAAGRILVRTDRYVAHGTFIADNDFRK